MGILLDLYTLTRPADQRRSGDCFRVACPLFSAATDAGVGVHTMDDLQYSRNTEIRLESVRV